MALSLVNLQEKLGWLMDQYRSEPTGVYTQYRAVGSLPFLSTRFLYGYVLPGLALTCWLIAALVYAAAIATGA